MIEIDCELYEAEPEVVDYINTLVRELREEREKMRMAFGVLEVRALGHTHRRTINDR